MTRDGKKYLEQNFKSYDRFGSSENFSYNTIMGKKKTSHIIKIGLYGILGLMFLAGGILYARFEKR